MIISLLSSSIRTIFLRRRQLLIYTATWTALLTTAVALTSFSPEIAFVWAVSNSSPLSMSCKKGHVRVPLEGPVRDVSCLPAQLFEKKMGVDFMVPPLFAALVVGGAACLVRAIGFGEVEDDDF